MHCYRLYLPRVRTKLPSPPLTPTPIPTLIISAILRATFYDGYSAKKRKAQRDVYGFWKAETLHGWHVAVPLAARLGDVTHPIHGKLPLYDDGDLLPLTRPSRLAMQKRQSTQSASNQP